MLEVLYHYAKFGGTRISPAAGAAKSVEFFVCLSVCLSVCLFVTLLNVRDWAPDFTIKPLEYRKKMYDAIGQGRFVVVHPCSTVSDCCQLATPLNAEVQKKDKNWAFFAARGRQNKPIQTKFGT